MASWRPPSAAGAQRGAFGPHVTIAARPLSAAGTGGGLATRRKHQLTLSLSEGCLRPSTPAGGGGGSPSPKSPALVSGLSPSSGNTSPFKDGCGSRPSTASPVSRGGRFTAEEKACFKRIPTPSAGCDEKIKTYFETTGMLRKGMSDKGLSCFPVDKGEFFNHPQLRDRQQERKIRRQGSGKRSMRQATRRSNAFGIGNGPPPLPIEPIAAATLEEILPMSPSGKDLFSSLISYAVSPHKSIGLADLLESAMMAPAPTIAPTSTTHGGTTHGLAQTSPNVLQMSTASKSPTAQSNKGAHRFDVLRSFRAAVLNKSSTILQAFDRFARDVDPELDLTKAEWRRLLMKWGFPEFAGRVEVNDLFEEMDINGDNYVSLKEWYVVVEMAAPVRSLEALRRRWLATGCKSMVQVLRKLDPDPDHSISASRLELSEFGALLSQTEVMDESEHRSLFFSICGEGQTTTCLDELFCAVAAVSGNLLLEDFRERLSKKFKGDYKKAFSYMDADHGGFISKQEFLNIAMNRLDTTKLEAEKMFRIIDVNGSGEITPQEFESSMRIAEPSLFHEELRFKIRQRFHSIRETLNIAFADEVTDGLQLEIALSKARFAEVLVPLGLLESEVIQMFDLVDEKCDGEMVARDFVNGVKRFAPACVLEDLRVRACQEYSNLREVFSGTSARRWSEPLNFKAFLKKLTTMRLARLGEDDIDMHAIFDLLDVSCQGTVTIGRLFAALCSCGVGSRLRLPDDERDLKARETVHGDVAHLQRQLWDFRKEIRLGIDYEAPVASQEKSPDRLGSTMRRTQLANAMSVTGTLTGTLTGAQALGDGDAAGSAREAKARDGTKDGAAGHDHDTAKVTAKGMTATRHDHDTDKACPRLHTATQAQIEPFLKAVPALAADCTCSAELTVFDTKDSFRRVWETMQEVPKHLAPSAEATNNVVHYYQSVVMRLSQDAPLHHKVESRMETVETSRNMHLRMQGRLRPASQGGSRPAAAALGPRPSSQGGARPGKADTTGRR